MFLDIETWRISNRKIKTREKKLSLAFSELNTIDSFHSYESLKLNSENALLSA